MSRKTPRAEARRRSRRGQAPVTAGGLGRNQLIGAAVLALAVVAALIWVSNNNIAATPVPTIASFSPAPSGTGFSAQAAQAIGDPNAKVTIDEWADFQCPACGQFARQTEPQLIQNYINTGKVRFVYRPLPFVGQESVWAAQAAECAADQGKFWEFHDKLYNSQAGENTGTFTNENLKKFGSQLGLGDQFAQCVDSNGHAAAVSASLAQGTQLGVQSTPTLFINGKKYVGAYSYDQLKAIIDPLLK